MRQHRRCFFIQKPVQFSVCFNSIEFNFIYVALHVIYIGQRNIHFVQYISWNVSFFLNLCFYKMYCVSMSKRFVFLLLIYNVNCYGSRFLTNIFRFVMKRKFNQSITANKILTNKQIKTFASVRLNILNAIHARNTKSIIIIIIIIKCFVNVHLKYKFMHSHVTYFLSSGSTFNCYHVNDLAMILNDEWYINAMIWTNAGQFKFLQLSVVLIFNFDNIDKLWYKLKIMNHFLKRKCK